MLLRWPEIASGSAEKYDGTDVEIIGWMAPADDAERHGYFLLVPEAICCLGCLPSDPGRCIEVFAAAPIPLDGKPVHLKGRFHRLVDDPAGWRYQMREARLVATLPQALVERLLTRRSLLGTGVALALAACASDVPSPKAASVAAPERAEEHAAAARQVLAAAVTVDLHSHEGRLLRRNSPFSDVAAPMRDGGMAVICLAVVADSPVTQILPDRRIKAVRNPSPGELYAWSGTSFRRAMALIAEQQLGLVTDVAALKAAPSKGPSVIVTSEGADWLDTSIERLDEAYEKYHLRQLQLTH